ncbi:MAG TPA: prepilin-type N-terminal cleavage/methylation domain-containing protein [Candidatus Ligilactobacillus excrementavium]|nr:prepilin-type N-terminal cleavage/methylation domain-containing protein [Candidatus Ligilactobacillus excrementavium]
MIRKSYLWKLKNENKGFTLIETVVALSISLISVVLLCNFLTERQKEIYSPTRTDRQQIIATIATLQSSQLSLKYKDDSAKQLVFYSPTKDMDYSLKLSGHRLVMRGKNEGYMPLLFNVDDGAVSFDEPYLKLDLKMNGVWHHEKIAFSQKTKPPVK